MIFLNQFLRYNMISNINLNAEPFSKFLIFDNCPCPNWSRSLNMICNFFQSSLTYTFFARRPLNPRYYLSLLLSILWLLLSLLSLFIIFTQGCPKSANYCLESGPLGIDTGPYVWQKRTQTSLCTPLTHKWLIICICQLCPMSLVGSMYLTAWCSKYSNSGNKI